MFQITHKRLYQLSGAIWLLIGAMLLRKGVHYLFAGWDGTNFTITEYSSLFCSLARTVGTVETAICLLVLCALSIGILKGRMVLTKVALRSQKRIALLKEPTSITQLYTRGNALVLFLMMGLGILLNILNVYPDIRAFIDIAVGSALIQGSLSYFRLQKSTLTKSM